MNPGVSSLLASFALGFVGFVTAAGPGLAGQSAAVLFPKGGIQRVEVSPAGDWVLAWAVYGNASGVLVQSTSTAEIVNVFATRMDIDRLAWTDRDTLLVQYDGLGKRHNMVVRFRLEAGRLEFDQDWIAVPGWLVDPLPLVEDEVVWHTWERGKASLRRVGVERLLQFRKRGARSRPLGDRLVLLDGAIGHWITNGEGEPYAARQDEAESSSILYRPEGESGFREVYRYSHGDEAARIRILSLAPDGERLIVSAYHGHDTKGLYEFDPAKGEIVETLFRHDESDVSDVLVDPITRELIAVEFVERGDTRYEYFSGYGKNFLTELGGDFPKESVAVISSTADRRGVVFRVSSARNPGDYHFYDSRSRKTTRIAEGGFGIDRDALADVESVLVRSQDGTEIEAYLTLPRVSAGERVPLVVMPHGGPFGVRDKREYNPFVQYLASWGFAVLQPNFRGSKGYGLAFRAAGKKAWAKGIEDDIDAAVDYAIALPQIDGERICIVGGSYGGFSAVASIVRHKQRYRCAISINGVSDIPLLYDSSDIGDSKRALAFYEEFVGDLETEREKLIDVSPAYRVEEVETPILLIYGTADRRVDPDHSHRMRLMLETLGKEHDAMEVEDMRHGPSRDQWVDVVRRARAYLTQYLLPESTFRDDPESRGEAGPEADGEVEPPEAEREGAVDAGA